MEWYHLCPHIEKDNAISNLQTSSVCSVFGAVFTLFSYFKFTESRKCCPRIMLFLSIAELGAASAWLICVPTSFISNQMQGHLLELFYSVSYVWTAYFAFHLYLAVWKSYKFPEVYECYYHHAVCWGSHLETVAMSSQMERKIRRRMIMYLLRYRAKHSHLLNILMLKNEQRQYLRHRVAVVEGRMLGYYVRTRWWKIHRAALEAQASSPARQKIVLRFRSATKIQAMWRCWYLFHGYQKHLRQVYKPYIKAKWKVFKHKKLGMSNCKRTEPVHPYFRLI